MKLILITIFAIAAAHGVIVEIKNKTWPSQWELVAKFCFDAEGGTINIKASDIPPNQNIIMYHDFEITGFSAIAESGHDCNYKSKQHDVLPISHNDLEVNSAAGRSYNVFSKYRPRWWFMVLANCDEAAYLPAPYTYAQNLSVGMIKFEFLNNDAAYPHMSATDQGIFETLIVALVGQLILLAASCYMFKKQLADEGQKIHQLTFCFVLVLAFEIIACIFKIAHYDTLNSDGVGHPSYIDFANLVDLFPDTIMVALFILMSKGWQVNEANFARLDSDGKRSCIEYFIFYLSVSIALYSWNFNNGGKAWEDKFFYQSPPGYLIVALHCLTVFWFSFNCVMTWRNIKNHLVAQAFYLGFTFLGVVYMFLLPIVVIVAEYLHDYNRMRAVCITQITLNLFVYIVFFCVFGLNAHHLKKDIQEGMTFGGAVDSTNFDDGMIDLGAQQIGTAELENDVEFDE